MLTTALINDMAVPLDDMPEELLDLDIDVPLSDVPRTGDVSEIWLVSAAVSALGLAVLFYADKKKRDEA